MISLTKLAILLPCAVVQVLACGATTKVCHTPTGICFNEFSDKASRTSIGIVLPPLQNVAADAGDDPFQEDILVNLTTAFPYGYAGLGRGVKDTGKQASSFVGNVLSTWMAANFASPSGLGNWQTTLIAQYSAPPSPTNKTHLVPITGANLLFSNLSRWDDKSGSFVFRCRQCDFGFTKDNLAADGTATLNVFRSELKPISAPNAFNGTLLTANATIVPFDVHVNDLRAQEYHDYLVAANVLGWTA